jgi:hypothetical protein
MNARSLSSASPNGNDLPLGDCAASCDHCGSNSDKQTLRNWHSVDRVYVPKTAGEVTLDTAYGLAERPASGGRRLISKSTRHVYLKSTYHLCAVCLERANAEDETLAFKHRNVTMAILVGLMLLSGLLCYPGFVSTIMRIQTGRTAAYWDYSTHPIMIPTTPYKDPFPHVPDQPTVIPAKPN